MTYFRGDQSTPREDDISDGQRELLQAFFREHDAGRLLSRPVGYSWIAFNHPIHVHGIDITQTKPDYNWKPLRVLGYLDGPAHLKDRRRERDEAITERLEDMGYEVHRWPFTRWTKRREREIVAEITQIINRKVSTHE